MRATNLNAMVQVDISQLSAECNAWRQQLRNLRDEFTKNETRLQQAVSGPLRKEQFQEVEHLHNQFHIQLINIHDLKQAIKSHDRRMSFERAAFNGSVNEDSLTRHETLLLEFQSLQNTLEQLRFNFNDFLSS